ncbi:MAG: hypothetical protein WD002_02870 [Pseudomonadales bacterium]
MRHLITPLMIILLCSPVYAADPQDTLDRYFKVLTTRNIQPLPELMTSTSMKRLKTIMDTALLQEGRASVQLQQRMFGGPVDAEKIKATPPDYYLLRLAEEILQAAEMQRFFVDNRRIIGQIVEADNMVHFVVRLFMHQNASQNSDLLVYTLIEEDGVWKMNFPPILTQTLGLIEAMAKPTK